MPSLYRVFCAFGSAAHSFQAQAEIMKLQFLGILGSVQAEDSGNVSLVITGGGSSVLVDVSGSPAQLLLRAGVDPLCLDAVFLSHTHTDHLYGLPSLIHNLWLLKRERPLPVYANRETLDRARALCAVFELEAKKGMFPLQWREAEASVSANDFSSEAGLHSQAFRVRHGVPTLGFIFAAQGKKIVYTCDTMPMEEYPAAAAGPDMLIHEAGGTEDNREKLLAGGHSSGADAARAAKSLGANRLFLCHLPPEKENRAAILAEARSIFHAAEIPERFVP
jgi:ribonuclease Z